MEQVAHLGILSVHIELIFLVASHLDRLATHNLQAETIQTIDLGRIIGHEAQLMNAQIGKDGGSGSVFAQVGRKAQCQVCLDRVHALILQAIGPQLIDQTNASTFLTKIEQHTSATGFDAAKGLGQLFATITSQAAKGIARKALGMNSAQDRLGRSDIAFDQSHMMLPGHAVDIAIGLEGAVFGGKLGHRDLRNQLLGLATIGHQIGYGDDDQLMPLGEVEQFGGAHHRTILAHDLATEATLLQPGQPAEVDRGLGMARANQDSSIAGLKREHVARTTEIARLRAIGHDGSRGDATLHGRDACGRGDMIDADGKGREVIVAVVGAHLRQVESFADLAAHGHADQSLGLRCHEIDILGSGELGGTDQIALVLTFGIVEHQDALALAHGFKGLVYCVESIHISMCKSAVQVCYQLFEATSGHLGKQIVARSIISPEQLLDILGYHIILYVDKIAHTSLMERCGCLGVRNERNGK